MDIASIIPHSLIHVDLVRLAKKLGIIKIAELYVDATRIKANSSRSRMMTAAKATELLKIIDQQIEAFMQATEAADRADELLDDPAQGEQLPGPNSKRWAEGQANDLSK